MRVAADDTALQVRGGSRVMGVQRGRSTQTRVGNTMINFVVALRDRLISALANAGESMSPASAGSWT